jgi:cytochrome c biogenesis protein CcmG, thiol:disulfide interchange protein DsbE
MAKTPSSSRSGSSPTTGTSLAAALPQKQRTGLLIGVGVSILAVLLAVAIFATKDSKSNAPKLNAILETAPVVISGQSLAPLAESPDAPDPAIGSKAPTIAGQAFDGSPLPITAGTSGTVIAFVAHWCPHCQREVPLLAQWAPNGIRKGVDVRAVSTSVTSSRPNYPPSAWLAREKFTIPTVVDDENSSAAEAFGLTSLPYFVAINNKGNVVARTSGEITESEFDALLSQAKSK